MYRQVRAAKRAAGPDQCQRQLPPEPGRRLPALADNTPVHFQRLLRRLHLVECPKREITAGAVVLDAAGKLRLGQALGRVLSLHQAQPPVVHRLTGIVRIQPGGHDRHSRPHRLAKRCPAALLNLRKDRRCLLGRDLLVDRTERDRPAHTLMLNLGRPATHPVQFTRPYVTVPEHTRPPVDRLQPLVPCRLAGFNPVGRRLLGHAWTFILARFSKAKPVIRLAKWRQHCTCLDVDSPGNNDLDSFLRPE